MFFILKDPERIVIRSEEAQLNNQGRKVKTLKRRLYAQFERGIPPWAVETATRHFDFSYMPPERTVQQWCGFYDSEADQIHRNWTDEERAEIERVLIEKNYVQIEKDKAPLPYPAYAKHRKVHGKRLITHAIDDITTTLDSTGIEPGYVIAYELDHEDEHSAAIIAAVQGGPPNEPVEEMIAA